MKYWRGYLAAAIFAVTGFALMAYAQAHSVLVDMIYPYMTRMVITSLSNWSGVMNFSLWQVLLIGLFVALTATVILMIVLRWNFFQWLGWVFAAISCIFMLNTGLYGLNRYASPLADDVRLEVSDYTVSELNEATLYFRDQANRLAMEIGRDQQGDVNFGTFEDMAKQAGDGYTALAYDQAISVFAGSTAPVKKLGFGFLYGKNTGVTVALTGEASVNPNVPDVALPFAMCKEMAHRMCIYSDADAAFAAYLAGTSNPSKAFQYSANLVAYTYCYNALKEIPTSTAQACATQVDSGVNKLLRRDLEAYIDFFGDDDMAENNRAEIPESASAEDAPIHFSLYSNAADLLTNWYVEKFVVPLHVEEEAPFNPLDPTQVDLSGLVNAKKK